MSYHGKRVRLIPTEEAPEQFGIAMNDPCDGLLLVEILTPEEYAGGVEVNLDEVELME